MMRFKGDIFCLIVKECYEQMVMDTNTRELKEREGNKMAFLKFIDKKGADSFMSGTAQFGQIKKYLEMEQNKCIGKYDEFESKFHTTKHETPQGIPTQLNITSNRECVNYALCLYHLDNKRSTDRITEMFEFGDFVVKIDNEQEFDRRIKSGAARNKYVICGRDILYYRDKSIEDEMKVMDLMTQGLDYISFAKREEIFSYQNEYRYLIIDENENNETIRFDIGCLKDIAVIMSKNEFLDACKL